MKLLKNLTKYEKIYICIFLGSLIAGIINGVIDTDYFLCCEESIGVPDEGTSALKIFQNNFILSVTEMFTAGLSGLYFNFHTFSIASSYLNSQNALYTLIFIIILGSLELIGSVLMSLIGITFIERKVFKIKTKLKYNVLFFLATALIFIGAVIEYVLIS